MDAVQDQLAKIGAKMPQEARRPAKLLSKLGRCGQCDNSFTIVRKERWGCRGFRQGGPSVCGNNRTIDNEDFERRVIGGLTEQLLEPQMVSAFVREYHEDYTRRAADLSARNGHLRAAVEEAEERIARLVDAVADGGGQFAEIRTVLQRATEDRDGLRAERADLECLPVVARHPQIAGRYRVMVRDLAAAMTTPEALKPAAPDLRALIDTIILTPATRGTGLDIQIVGRLANMLAITTGKPTEQNAPAGTLTMER